MESGHPLCDFLKMSVGRLYLIIGIAGGLALLSACERRAPQMSEADLRELQTSLPGMTNECVEKARFGGTNAISSLSVDQCFEMAPARNWRGLWRDEFEGSMFCPQPAKQCRYDTSGDNISLSYSKFLKQQGEEPHKGDGALYDIEFVGRSTAKRGHFGHEGAFNYQVVVDRIISLRPVPAP